MQHKIWILAAILGLGARLAAAQEPDDAPPKRQGRDLTEMSLEELMRLDVTSVSKREQSLRTAPAAITVIRGDDLRRTGATSIPEALRLVPGLYVSRLNANQWVISSRGFADLYANKLLVLIDGRSVYTPLFSGVFWTMQDVRLDDVDRIEVIRGPGATVWGANAVNGVISIITKKASETQGTSIRAGAGSEERLFGSARYGGKAGDDLFYRAYAKYFNRDSFTGGDDDWEGRRGGFRSDWKSGDADRFTFQGDVFEVTAGSTLTKTLPTAPFSLTAPVTTRYSGGNLLSRWEHEYSPTSKLRTQLYWDRTVYDDDLIGETRDTGDLDIQHQFEFFSGQKITWGGGYRITTSNTRGTFNVREIPDHRSDDTASTFVQDEIPLVDTLSLTLGSKFEYNDYTGFEIQPGLRLAWAPVDRHFLWASVARAVRTPSMSEADTVINFRVLPPAAPGLPPTSAQVRGQEDFGSEVLVAYESGYRVQPLDALMLDVCGFYNVYTHLRSTDSGTFETSDPALFVQPLLIQNNLKGHTWGFEAAALWQVVEDVRLQGGYSFFRMNLIRTSGSNGPEAMAPERDYPRHQAFLRGSVDVIRNVQLDLVGRYVGALEASDVSDYFQMDARIGWQVLPTLETALVGQNLCRKSHFEQAASSLGTHATEVQRGVYASMTWRF